MERKTNLDELHKKLLHYLVNNNFSDYKIKACNKVFGKLNLYMLEVGSLEYTEEVGFGFMDSVDKLRYAKNKLARPWSDEQRYLDLIEGIAKGKSLVRKFTANYDAKFPGTFSGYVADFLLQYQIERRLNSRTRNNYYRCLYRFCDRMNLDGVKKLSEIKMDNVLGFMSSLQNCKDHAKIILKVFLAKLYEEKVIDYSTANILNNFKVKPTVKLPSYFSPEEIISLESAVDRRYPKGKRDYAMILLATRLGFRSSDIRFLKFKNINWDNNLIVLEQFKTKKPIALPLLAEIGEALVDYIKNGRPICKSEYIFLRIKPPYEPLATGGFYVLVQKYLQLANVVTSKKKSGVHAFRHSLASNLVRKGTPIGVVSDVLGHSTYDSTNKYIHLNVRELLTCSLDVPEINKNFYLQLNKEAYE